ncbi:DoxX family protein [Saccharopolyspora hirsuta]|uniref:DoxX family protein n=1 Tax=Saccharopolyspora hirsuta TaxID=1837 RepID=UPI00331FE043
MNGLPHVWWPTALLALVLLGDAAMSLKPPGFIQRCLEGVRLPREWWWTLVVIKLLAVAGLLVGLRYPGIALATNAAVIAYFVCAAYAHVRVRFLGREFWLNCLGMLTFSTAVLVFSHAV